MKYNRIKGFSIAGALLVVILAVLGYITVSILAKRE